MKFKNNIFSKLAFLALLIISLFWTISAIILTFLIDVDNTIIKNNFHNAKYSDYSIQYFITPKIIINNFNTNNLRTSKVIINFSLLSYFTFSPIIKQITYRDSTAYFNNGNNDLFQYAGLINDIINNNDSYNIDFEQLNIITSSAELSFPNLKINNSADSFSLKTINDNFGNIDFYIIKHKSKPILSLIAKDTNQQLEIQQIYSDPEHATGRLKYSSKQGNIIITSDLKLENHTLSLKNLVCKGDTVSGALDLELHRDKIHLTGKFAHLIISDSIIYQRLFSLLDQINNHLIYIDNRDIAIDFYVTDMMLLNQKIGQFRALISTDKKTNNLQVQQITGALDNSGSFLAQGAVKYNSHRAAFDGNFALAHKDINKLLSNLAIITPSTDSTLQPSAVSLKSGMHLSKYDIVMSNLIATINNIDISGDVSMKNIASQIRYVGDLQIQHFDSQQYTWILSDAIAHAKKICTDSYQADYLEYFVPIRNNQFLVNINLSTVKPKLFEQVYDKIDVLLKITKNNIEFKSFNIQNPTMKTSGNINLNIANFEPIFSINLNSGTITTPGLSSILIDLHNLLQKQVNLDNLTISSQIKLDELVLDSLKLKNFVADIATNQESVLVNNLSFTVFDGTAQFNGNLIPNPFLVNLGYAYNRANLDQIFDNSIILQGAKGLLSSNGIISFSGDSLDEMLYTLKVYSNFIGSNIIINGINIDGLISKISQSTYNAKDLETDLKLYTNNGYTKFTKLNGSVNMESGLIEFKDCAFNTLRSAGAFASNIDFYKQNIGLIAGFNFEYNNKNIGQLKLNLSDYLFSPKNHLQLDR